MEIIVAGDFCPRDRTQHIFDKEQYEFVLSDLKTVLENTDYAIVNLECPVVTKDAIPIKKEGPNLKTNLSGLKAIQYAGFDCVTLANNHFYDFGEKGVDDTLSALENLKIDFCGGGKNYLQASKIFYKEINTERLAVINCCEHEFSIAGTKHGGSNPLNSIRQFYAITEARQKADYVLVIVHGGHEHYPLPSPRMKELYHFFIDVGADVVVNHHQHCYSGYEIYKEKPIFYGLGNLLFDVNPIKTNDRWNYGYMVKLLFDKHKIGYSLHPYSQCNPDVTVKMLDFNAFDNKLAELNSIIADDELLLSATESFYMKTCQTWGQFIEPIFNRYYGAALKRGLVPSLISQRRMLCAENYICCESHRDKLIYFLNKTISA